MSVTTHQVVSRQPRARLGARVALEARGLRRALGLAQLGHHGAELDPRIQPAEERVRQLLLARRGRLRTRAQRRASLARAEPALQPIPQRALDGKSGLPPSEGRGHIPQHWMAIRTALAAGDLGANKTAAIGGKAPRPTARIRRAHAMLAARATRPHATLALRWPHQHGPAQQRLHPFGGLRREHAQLGVRGLLAPALHAGEILRVCVDY